jgi:hypothetical protein
MSAPSSVCIEPCRVGIANGSTVVSAVDELSSGFGSV